MVFVVRVTKLIKCIWRIVIAKKILLEFKFKMNVTLKLYAMLGKYLPDDAKSNEAVISLSGTESVVDVLNRYGVPLEQCHLVLINGNYVEPSARDTYTLKEDDHMAVWPPIAGG
jgi:molybdopterin converting factor small subunit